MENKEKVCFVIMPISDHDEYPSNHFKRVYDYLIKPACELAGFKPIRADEVMNTNYIALDIVKYIIEADMAICDLSSKNPNVLYELGIRQAFNKPVTLIKDNRTQRIFDISGFRDVEYDDSLRIDTVNTTIENIAETIKNTYETNGHEINSLVSLLGIEPATVGSKIEISKETELIMRSIYNLESKIAELVVRPTIENNSDVNYYITTPNNLTNILTIEEMKSFKPGDRVFHAKFGTGTFLKMEGLETNPIAEFMFDGDHKAKKLMLNYAKLKKLAT